MSDTTSVTIGSAVPTLHVHPDHESAAVAALDRCETLLGQIDAERAPRLALPTGRSYVPFYAELAARHPRGEPHREVGDEVGADRAHGALRARWRETTGLNLDELVLPAGHPRSFAAYMDEHVWSRTVLDASRFSIPDGAAVYGGTEDEFERLCSGVDARAAELEPLDVALLGIGADGHIAYNLPDRVHENTHAVELPDALAEELGVPESERPLRAVTLGFGPLRRACHLLLLVAGPEKAEALRHLFHGEADARWPCTLLREHPRFEVFADEAAAQHLDHDR